MNADDAVDTLLRAAGDRLLRLAFQLSHDRATAEDLVQEALTRVYGSWRRRLPDVEHAEAYVRRAIVNEFIRTRRLRSSTELVTADVPEVATLRDLGDDVVEQDAMWTALGALEPRPRAVLVLRYYADLPDSEIAALVGCREATVRSIAARALATLRTITRELT